ncbi:MAG: hypothetical protein EOO75_12720 [Myxococcales bacterium]|nr:MAG: hypothetical protein EOO75_12720 [Myxococcales bacterium]
MKPGTKTSKPAEGTTHRTTDVGETEEQRLHDADALSEDEHVDLNSYDSFPASDTPSFSPSTTGGTAADMPERDPRIPGNEPSYSS